MMEMVEIVEGVTSTSPCSSSSPARLPLPFRSKRDKASVSIACCSADRIQVN